MVKDRVKTPDTWMWSSVCRPLSTAVNFNPQKDDAQKKKQNQELRELRDLNTKLSKDLATKNREIDQLKIKIDKLERDLNNAKGSAGSAQEEEGNFKRGKRQAQIEEPSPQNVQLVKTDKSKATAELLKNALKECDLLRRLEISHIEGIVYHCPS